jgi:hypothetical protein
MYDNSETLRGKFRPLLPLSLSLSLSVIPYRLILACSVPETRAARIAASQKLPFPRMLSVLAGGGAAGNHSDEQVPLLSRVYVSLARKLINRRDSRR